MARWVATACGETILPLEEKLCYVALDFDSEMKQAALSHEGAKTYELPDGHVISLHAERFRCAELLFQPSLMGKEAMGIHDTTFQSIMRPKENLKSGCSTPRNIF